MMKAHSRIRILAWGIAFVGIFALTTARADVYTWVDPSGNVNLSNRPPPEGVRVTNVYREDPVVHASAESARTAAQQEELNVLTDRVAQLERDLEAASRPPPAPVAYAPPTPPPAPAPYPPVIAQTIVVPATMPYGGDCTDSWGCFSTGYFGFYPSGIVVVGVPASHHHRPAHRGPPVPAPRSAHFAPVGALPDPVNLFPGVHRR
jgi:hypothetical protein